MYVREPSVLHVCHINSVFSLHVAFYGPLKIADVLIQYCAKVMIVEFIELHCFSILLMECNKFLSKMIC